MFFDEVEDWKETKIWHWSLEVEWNVRVDIVQAKNDLDKSQLYNDFPILSIIPRTLTKWNENKEWKELKNA